MEGVRRMQGARWENVKTGLGWVEVGDTTTHVGTQCGIPAVALCA